MRVGLAVVFSLVAISRACAGDLAFHISEDVAEDEVRPRIAHYLTHWEGDYYVAEASVTVSGWGRKPGTSTPQPLDTPIAGTNRWGSASITTFHRTEDSLDVTIVYGTFVVHRHMVMTGPQSCTVEVAASLKPSETLFEVHRRSNSEPMFDRRRDFLNPRCRPPALSS